MAIESSVKNDSYGSIACMHGYSCFDQYCSDQGLFAESMRCILSCQEHRCDTMYVQTRDGLYRPIQCCIDFVSQLVTHVARGLIARWSTVRHSSMHCPLTATSTYYKIAINWFNMDLYRRPHRCRWLVIKWQPASCATMRHSHDVSSNVTCHVTWLACTRPLITTVRTSAEWHYIVFNGYWPSRYTIITTLTCF